MTATVLLPVFNGTRTLRAAIDSILAQDDPDFELLVIDDASTDDSPAIANGFAATDDRVTAVLHERNAGLAATLNEGLERARHDLVIRMDQDDESVPARLRVQSAFMDTHPSVVVAGSWVRHMGARPNLDRVIKLPVTPKEVARTLQWENCLYHPSVIMRRSVVRELGGYREAFRNAEDYDLWLRVSRAHDLANVPEPLLRYRFSPGGMTLKRKWHQLYYVHLAQATHRDPALSLEEAGAVARSTLARTDRRAFLTQTARGTVLELVRLRHWADALAVTGRFRREIGPVASANLVGLIARDYAMSRRAA